MKHQCNSDASAEFLWKCSMKAKWKVLRMHVAVIIWLDTCGMIDVIESVLVEFGTRKNCLGVIFEAAMKMSKRVQKIHAWAAFSAAKDHLAHLETAHKPWSKKINWLGASARKSKKAQNMSSAKCQMSISQVAAAVIILSPPLPDMKGGKKNVDELLTLWQWCVVCGSGVW